MNRINAIKKVVNRLLLVLVAVLVLLIVCFAAHVIRIQQYNAKDRSLSPLSTSAEVGVEVYPRGQTTDSWEKDDAFPGTPLYARIYEAQITNSSGSLLKDWKLRINIKGDCYLNNSWCGKVEIHQIRNGTEQVQTLDLRDYNPKAITIEHQIAGQDLLIPLQKNDYLIYQPNGSLGEVPLKSSSEFSENTIIGFIFYSLNGEIDLSDFSFDYHLRKEYLSGQEGKVFIVLFAAWILVTSFSAVISGLVLRFEEKICFQTQLTEEAIELCGKLADGKDYHEEGHSKRVAGYCRRIAEQMGMDKTDCTMVYYVAMLHELGNYYVSDQILRKPGALSGEEFEMVKNHTVKGAGLLDRMNSLPHAAEGALFHHEHYDGSGYPTGREGEEIPLVARIIAVGDAYDAMNHDRAFRKKMTREEIREEFIRNKGTQFDPVIVDVALELMNSLEEQETPER